MSSPDIALDEPIRDDGFGGEGVDFLADGFGDELGGEALVPGFDDLPTTVAAADVTLEPLDTNLVNDKESPVNESGQDGGEHFTIVINSFKLPLMVIFFFQSQENARNYYHVREALNSLSKLVKKSGNFTLCGLL